MALIWQPVSNASTGESNMVPFQHNGSVHDTINCLDRQLHQTKHKLQAFLNAADEGFRRSPKYLAMIKACQTAHTEIRRAEAQFAGYAMRLAPNDFGNDIILGTLATARTCIDPLLTTLTRVEPMSKPKFKVGDLVVDLVGGDTPDSMLATVFQVKDDGYWIEHFIDGKAPPVDTGHGPNGFVEAHEIRLATPQELAQAKHRSYPSGGSR
jgi:hypothetical protein